MKACEPQVDLSFESSFRDTEGVTDSDEQQASEDISTIFEREEAAQLMRHKVPDGTAHSLRLQINGIDFKVRKSFLLWLIMDGRVKRSCDRILRFREMNNTGGSAAIHFQGNIVLQTIAIGDWIMVKTNHDNNLFCHVSNFRYQSGKIKTCRFSSVPVECPPGVEGRGIWLMGNVYSIKDTQLSLYHHQCVDIQHYVSHVKAPGVGLKLSTETCQYISSLSQ
nr:uncharacterized protein LOC109406940 [Aedes albopictus]